MDLIPGSDKHSVANFDDKQQGSDGSSRPETS